MSHTAPCQLGDASQSPAATAAGLQKSPLSSYAYLLPNKNIPACKTAQRERSRLILQKKQQLQKDIVSSKEQQTQQTFNHLLPSTNHTLGPARRCPGKTIPRYATAAALVVNQCPSPVLDDQQSSHEDDIQNLDKLDDDEQACLGCEPRSPGGAARRVTLVDSGELSDKKDDQLHYDSSGELSEAEGGIEAGVNEDEQFADVRTNFYPEMRSIFDDAPFRPQIAAKTRLGSLHLDIPSYPPKYVRKGSKKSASERRYEKHCGDDRDECDFDHEEEGQNYKEAYEGEYELFGTPENSDLEDEQNLNLKGLDDDDTDAPDGEDNEVTDVLPAFPKRKRKIQRTRRFIEEESDSDSGGPRSSISKQDRSGSRMHCGDKGAGIDGRTRDLEAAIGYNSGDEKVVKRRRRSCPKFDANLSRKIKEIIDNKPPFEGEQYDIPDFCNMDPNLRNLKFETQEFKDWSFEIGDLVYCPFGQEGKYYWGYIYKKKASEKAGMQQQLFWVDFDDGDVTEGVSSRGIYSKDEFERIRSCSNYFEKFPPNQPPSPELMNLIWRNRYEYYRKEILDDGDEGSGGRLVSDDLRSCSDESALDAEDDDQLNDPENFTAASKGSSTSHSNDEGPIISLSDLRTNQCQQCSRCMMPDCKQCFPCFRNSTGSHPEVVCIRKICSKACNRKQPMKGFPKGWTFFFGSGKEPSQHGLDGLVMTSPNNENYTSIEAIMGSDLDDVNRRLQCFLHYLGTRWVEEIPTHDLINRRFQSEWLDSFRMRCRLVGTVIKAEINRMDGELGFTVAIESLGRLGVSQTKEMSGTLILSESATWGGCVSSVSDLRPPPNLPCIKWIVPQEKVRTGIDRSVDHLGLPWMEMIINGYFLRLEVKQSSILTGGRGVFVQCTPKENEQGATVSGRLILPPGHLIDCGIYGPLHPSERKSKAEFVAKNFIHSFRPEEFALESLCPGTQTLTYVDLTDDSTGLLCNLARRHIPPYVNEIDDPETQTPNIHKVYDYQGSLHYLLGHARQNDGPFEIIADGEFHEVLTDYGQNYERVRLRKGYPRSHLDEIPEERKAAKRAEMEYLDQLEHWEYGEIAQAVNFVEEIVNRNRSFEPNAIANAVIFFVVVRKCAGHFPEAQREDLRARTSAVLENLFDLDPDKVLETELPQNPFFIEAIGTGKEGITQRSSACADGLLKFIDSL